MLQWRASAGSQTAQVIHQKSSIQQMQTSPCPSAALTVLQCSSCSHHLHCLHCLPTSLFPPPHPLIHAATLVSSHSCHLPSSLPHLPLPPSPFPLLLASPPFTSAAALHWNAHTSHHPSCFCGSTPPSPFLDWGNIVWSSLILVIPLLLGLKNQFYR